MTANHYTEGHCAEKRKPGGCQLHNLHCGYPECDRKAAPAPAEAHELPPLPPSYGTATYGVGLYTAGQMQEYAQAALDSKAQPKGMPADWRDAMQEALSVCDSVSMSRDRRVVREGCVLYLQTEEWCKWAEQEVAPKLRHALKAATVQAPAPAPVKRGLSTPWGDADDSGEVQP